MAFQYRHGLLQREAYIRALVLAILVLLITQGFLMGLCYRLQQEQVVRIPADLRYTTRQRLADVPEPFVYSFAYYMLQQVYRWPENGEQDFPKKIYALQAYLTEDMREQLTGELQRKAKEGELRKRVRWVREIPGKVFTLARVKALGGGQWIVYLDLEVQEFVQGKSVKNVRVRYPIRVVHYDVDPEQNAYALALDGFLAPGPQLINDNDVEF